MFQKLSKSTRFEMKVDRIIWTLIIFIPFIAYLFSYGFVYKGGSSIDFITLETYLIQYRFNFAYNILTDLLQLVFETVPVNTAFLSFISYMFFVELIHVFYDVLVFIPRFCHELIAKVVPNE